VPLLFLLASVAMVVNALATDPVNTGITFGIILAGVPAYLLWRTWNSRLIGPGTDKAFAADERR
jgi:hypothetical protein